MFGKSASSITDYLIKTDSFDAEHCASLLCGQLKKKKDEVIKSNEGYQITKEQKQRMLLIQYHLNFLENTIESLEEAINKPAVSYESAISLLCTIPRIKRISAISIISEIGTDMSLLKTLNVYVVGPV